MLTLGIVTTTSLIVLGLWKITQKKYKHATWAFAGVAMLTLYAYTAPWNLINSTGREEHTPQILFTDNACYVREGCLEVPLLEKKHAKVVELPPGARCQFWTKNDPRREVKILNRIPAGVPIGKKQTTQWSEPRTLYGRLLFRTRFIKFTGPKDATVYISDCIDGAENITSPSFVS